MASPPVPGRIDGLSMTMVIGSHLGIRLSCSAITMPLIDPLNGVGRPQCQSSAAKNKVQSPPPPPPFFKSVTYRSSSLRRNVRHSAYIATSYIAGYTAPPPPPPPPEIASYTAPPPSRISGLHSPPTPHPFFINKLNKGTWPQPRCNRMFPPKHCHKTISRLNTIAKQSPALTLSRNSIPHKHCHKTISRLITVTKQSPAWP